MSNLLDLLVAGLATGAIYALVAVGFTLLWQTSQTINFAQGEFVMLGGMVTVFASAAGVPLPLAALLAVAVAVIVTVPTVPIIFWAVSWPRKDHAVEVLRCEPTLTRRGPGEVYRNRAEPSFPLLPV